jgi:uncharacterized membrane protein YphA (DoxX/SURF4 family)
MHILSIVLQIVLGLAFLMGGFTKFNSKQQIEAFKHYRLPAGFRIFTGIVEVVGAIALIAGIWNQGLAMYAALALAITMFFAVLTHLIRVNDPLSKSLPALILLILNVVVVIINWS